MNKILKYGIIAVAWIVFLALALSGGSSDTNKNSDSVIPPESSTVVSTVEDSNKLNVTLEVEPNVNKEDGSVLFGVTTNLPEGTELMVTVKKDGFIAQDKTVVLANGTGYTSEFSNKGEALKGDYIVTVSMSLPRFQKDEVQRIVGKNGENITGKYVQKDEITSSNFVSGDFEFSF